MRKPELLGNFSIGPCEALSRMKAKSVYRHLIIWRCKWCLIYSGLDKLVSGRGQNLLNLTFAATFCSSLLDVPLLNEWLGLEFFF